MVDAMKRASARRITAVLPYYGYARQDARCSPACPISASSWPICSRRRASIRLLALDLHAGQIQGFSASRWTISSPAGCDDRLPAQEGLQEPVIVAPDAGGVERARAMAKRFDAGLATSTSGARGRTRRSPCTSSATSRGATPSSSTTSSTPPHARPGGDRRGARGRPAHPGLRRPRGAVRAGDRPDQVVADRGDRRHEFDPGERGQARRGGITVLTVAPLLGEDPAHGARAAQAPWRTPCGPLAPLDRQLLIAMG